MPSVTKRSLVAAALGSGLVLSYGGLAVGQESDARRIGEIERQMAAAQQQMGRFAVAQLFGRPPANVPDAGAPGDAQPAQDAPELDLRVDRLENQMRVLTGQIEQTQFALHRLEEELKKLNPNADLRAPDENGRALRPPPRPRAEAAGTGTTDYPPGAAAAGAEPPPAGTVYPRHDAFDPAANPSAPGAPRDLGNLPAGPLPGAQVPVYSNPQSSGAPVETEPPGPLDLSGVGQRPLPPAASTEGPPPTASTRTAGLPGPAVLAPGGATVANAPAAAGGPREEFDAALSYLRQGEYATAQTSLESFIQKYPKDRLVADAVFYLGETYFQRGRHREAAEQYLKVATDYARSPRAPEGLVRLGMSLNALGAKEQACATFGEVGRKYPNASSAIKASVERELKRAKC